MSFEISTDYAAIFTRQKYVDRRIAKTTVQVYPTLTLDMLKSEKAYGYLVSKNAIFDSDAPIRSKLTAFGQCTDTTGLVDIIVSQFSALVSKMNINAT